MPVKTILLSFVTISLSWSIVVLHPSSANCPRDIRLELFKPERMRAFFAVVERMSENGKYPTLLSFMVVEFGRVTGGPVSWCIFLSADVSCARQKCVEAPLSALAIQIIFSTSLGGITVL